MVQILSHDVEAIAAAIAVLVEDEPRRRRLGAAARRTVAERFDLRANPRQIAANFARTLGG
jgi:glycosyltransferase involved in cell wall biosynthesis